MTYDPFSVAPPGARKELLLQRATTCRDPWWVTSTDATHNAGTIAFTKELSIAPGIFLTIAFVFREFKNHFSLDASQETNLARDFSVSEVPADGRSLREEACALRFRPDSRSAQRKNP
jgi:hypothetical protein